MDNMDIRISELLNANRIDTTKQNKAVDDSFKFTLLSNIEEADLQAKVGALLNEISEQGKKISKHTDVRDMKRYRELIKGFLNEVVYRSHKFSRENFLDRMGKKHSEYFVYSRAFLHAISNIQFYCSVVPKLQNRFGRLIIVA